MDFSSFSFIFVGDTHGYFADFEKQKEMIELVSPEYVLSEQLQDITLLSENDFLSLLNKRCVSSLVPFADVERLIQLCFQKGIKLVGIDLHNFGFDPVLEASVHAQKELADEEKIALSRILEKRQYHHLSCIKKYAALSKKPLVILVGTWHLQETTPVMKALSNYCVVYPCKADGSLLISPSDKKMKPLYGIRMKK